MSTTAPVFDRLATTGEAHQVHGHQRLVLTFLNDLSRIESGEYFYHVKPCNVIRGYLGLVHIAFEDFCTTFELLSLSLELEERVIPAFRLSALQILFCLFESVLLSKIKKDLVLTLLMPNEDLESLLDGKYTASAHPHHPVNVDGPSGCLSRLFRILLCGTIVLH
jgi:hypothetical protein